MASTDLKPNIVIPTGYETEQRKIAQKQKLADAMMSLAMQQDDGMTSWTQPLGKLAEAFAGKMLAKKADTMQGGLDTRIRGHYDSARTALEAAVKGGASPSDILQQFGNNPMLAEEVKPYREAFASKLKQNQELVQDGGFWRQKGDIQSGQAIAPDWNKDVIVGPDGQPQVNGAKLDYARAAQGWNVGGGGPYQDFPAHAGMAPIPGQQSAQNPTDKLAGIMAQARAVGRDPSVNPATIGARQPDRYTVDGKPAWLVNGQYYDNPEGR